MLRGGEILKDLFNISAYHYLYSGEAGLEHFPFMVNNIINDSNHLTIEELNVVWACILYKGHGKDRFVDTSYRTISICPFLSKALDTYIGDLYSSKWNSQTAETQYQQEGSSHDLAALTLTETIQHSLFSLSRPVFVVFLDAKNAFDKVVREILINRLYDCGISDHGLLLIDQR